MKILESLPERVQEEGGFQRAVILGPATGASHISVVLVRVPPQHEFPLHTHPRSEDCFFILSVAGEAVDPNQRVPISESTVVWIPVGLPHGGVAGPSGMLEIGFQSPPDPTAVPFEVRSVDAWPLGMLVQSIPAHPESAGGLAEWFPVFPTRLDKQYLDPHYSVLDASQQLRAEADGGELIVIIARGAIELSEFGARVNAIAALQFSPGEAASLRALEPSTLLLGVRALLAA